MSLLFALLLASGAPTQAAGPRATAALAAPSGTFARIGETAVAYVPPTARVPAPVLVVLHGAGKGVDDALRPLISEAATRGLVLLAVQSKGRTWDVVLEQSDPDTAAIARKTGGPRLPSGDRKRIDAAVDTLAGLIPVDKTRTGLFGFSDGASEALSLGAAEPERYRFVAGFAPGVLASAAPRKGSEAQRMIIAHAREDKILPYRKVARTFCPDLNRGRRQVRFITTPGGHEIDTAALKVALDDFLIPSSRPAANDPSYRCPS